MNRDPQTTHDRDARLEALAAELTLAAYRVALRARTEGTWLDLELDLWRTLADTVSIMLEPGRPGTARGPDRGGSGMSANATVAAAVALALTTTVLLAGVGE